MKNYILIGLRIVVVIILLQTLVYKFSAHPDSVSLFTEIGLEPYGRIGIGIIELISGILLLIPRTVWLGAGLTVGIMAGAIFMHLTKLGIAVNGDSGTLFYLALFTFLNGLVLLWVYRRDIPIIGITFKK